MSNVLRNRFRSSSETRHEFSINFIFDQIIKQKIFEIEKLGKIRPKSDPKRQKNNVLKIQKNKMKKYYKNYIFFRAML
jgi:hypothetical protein